MKFNTLEKLYIKHYWISERRYKTTGRVEWLFHMMENCSSYKEEITGLFFENKINSKEYEAKYRFNNLMELRAHKYFFELQSKINEMELDIIYNERR